MEKGRYSFACGGGDGDDGDGTGGCGEREFWVACCCCWTSFVNEGEEFVSSAIRKVSSTMKSTPPGITSVLETET